MVTMMKITRFIPPPKSWIAIAGFLILSTSAGLACVPEATPDQPPTTPSPGPAAPDPASGDDWGSLTVDEVLTPVVRDRILQTVAQDVNRPAADLRITAAETATWDGCMGIYVPDLACTAIALFGLRIVVTDGDQSWVYHTHAEAADLHSIVQNATASGSRNGLIVDFIPSPDPAPTAEDVVFRSVESGSLAGWQREIVLFADGRLQHREGDTLISEKRLSVAQVTAFQQVLEDQRFPNLHRMRYITDAAFADYPTVRLSAGWLQTEYIDLAIADAPPALQAVVEAWDALTQD